MDVQQLYRLIENEDDIEQSHQAELKAIICTYPYFQTAVFLYLKSLYLFDINSFRTELQRLSVSVVDRKALFFFIMREEYRNYFIHTAKRELKEDRSAILLNAFFETHENDFSDSVHEYNLTHSSLASSDYFIYVDKVEKKEIEDEPSPTGKESTELKHHSIIDSFIRKSEEEGGVRIAIDLERKFEPAEVAVSEDEDLNDDLFFTETLAKIYIKQKKYDKACKIIKHLSLNYPKKNVYFADQLSFLEKLIINSKFKDKK